MKKVYCYVGELNVEFQTSMSKHLARCFAESGTEIFFFANFDTTPSSASYTLLEKKIISLPCLDDCDGIIIFPDSYAIPGMAEELSEYVYSHAKCPVVSVRARDEKFYSITLGDYDAICEMTGHFINHHGMKRVCFMAGRMDLEDAHVRLAAYRDTMAKHGLEVTEGMIFYGDYWREKGDEAAEWFISKNSELPQAVVCSNDYMAISLCNAFVNRGYDVPGDVCISGLDDIDEVRFHIPPITSISASTERLAEMAFQIFRNLWDGKPQDKVTVLPLEPKYRNSCGCEKTIDYTYFQKLYSEKELYTSALNFSPYLGLEFESSDNMDDLVYALRVKLTNKTYGNPDDYGTLYLCLCDQSKMNFEDVDARMNFTDNIILKAVVSSSELETPGIVFPRSEILPARYRNSLIPMYVMPLHCKEYCFGYIVIQNNDISRFNHLIKTLVFSLGNSLDRIRMLNENQTVHEQSYTDELTGLPNRRSMERHINILHNVLQTSGDAFCVMSVDMDGLKYINDNFGHQEGDFAISTVASVLNECCENATVSRTGGDEFIVLIASGTEQAPVDYINAVNEKLKQLNETSGKQYEFSVSCGYDFCRRGMDISACIHTADSRMYENKRARKKNRV